MNKIIVKIRLADELQNYDLIHISLCTEAIMSGISKISSNFSWTSPVIYELMRNKMCKFTKYKIGMNDKTI